MLQGFALQGRPVEALLLEEKIDVERVQFGQEANQVLKAAAETIHAPRHHDIEFTLSGIAAKPVECRTLITPLSAANSMVL
jgi:hypothetical protein